MNKNISLSLVTALSLTALNAYEMKPVGFKATGMGGTGVASTRGSLSGYYNPALLRFSDYTAEFSINAGFRLRESNLIEPMDKLSDLEIDGVIQRIGDNAGVIGADNTAKGDDEKMAESLAILKNIGSSNAFQVSLTPSLTAQMSDALAVGVYSTIDVSMRLNIDEGHLALIFKDGGNYYGYTPSSDTYTPGFTEDQYKTTSLEYANSEEGGINYIAVDTMALVEIPISYARAYDWDSGTWSFGLNFKPMALVTTTEKVSLGESSDDAEDSDDSTTETTYKSTFGLDLGVAYRPIDSKMTLGLVGKNINTPTFKVESTPAVGQMGHRSEDYKIDPFFRAGLSVPIWNDNIEFALDIDLQKSDTLIEGEQSQFIGAGIELHPASWFAFRLGAMQDMASEKFDDGTIATVGLGVGLKWAQIDLSAMVGTNTGEYDGEAIPKYASINLSLISRWGDGYNRKEAPVSEEIQEEEDNKLQQDMIDEDKARIKKDSDEAFIELDKSL